MYRTLVILRHTFIEAVVQPIYPLLLAIGSAIMLIFGLLPFFTLSEDTVMFKSVCLDIILLLVLITTLFATSKSIYEEIEDRTMLTLMSKPLKKWEVLLGKYLGIVLAGFMATAILGSVIVVATWWRIPGDYLINTNTLDDRDLKLLASYRTMHIAGLFPALVLKWLQISVLAAVSVAISTRVSLVVNLPVVIFIYIAGNLTRFLFPLEGQSLPTKVLAWLLSTLLPYLEIFDLNSATVYQKIAVGQFANDPMAVHLSTIWAYVVFAFAYAVVYVFFALVAGLLLFENRELGGAEG
ncbi:MAG TPA: ABC transporter permease subunit [Tepidisphaeraceae bacterium]|jgi:ABC-type transport system involved in multi-copper enzyme maturation permease subunit|nr:ABC transporter permease subunit [Tepidisphaeraceae bacterium]